MAHGQSDVVVPVTVVITPGGVLAPDELGGPATLGVGPGWLSCVPWHGLRALVTGLRARVGPAVFDAAASPHRGVLGPYLAELDDGDATPEPVRLDALGVAGFLGRSGDRARFTHAWTELLRALLHASRTRRVAVANATALDTMSFGVLRALQGGPAEARVALMVGVDPRHQPDDWRVRRPVELAAAHVADLLAAPGTKVIERLLVAPREAGGVGPGALLEGGGGAGMGQLAEVRVLVGLAAPPSAWEPEEERVESALGVIRACMPRYAYTAALRFGLELLGRQGTMSPETRRELHRLIAVAATDRQGSGELPPALMTFVDDHLDAALADETDPAWRACLEGRRAMACATTDPVRALGFARRARRDAEVARVDEPLRNVLIATSHQAIARAHARLGAFDLALAEAEAACARLDAGSVEAGGATSEEMTTAAQKAAELSLRVGDRARAASWLVRALDAATPDALDPGQRAWIRARVARLEGDATSALGLLEAALADPVCHVDPAIADRLTREAGELAFRLGDAARALRHFHASLSLRERMGSPDDVRSALLVTSLAAGRLARWGEVERLSERALKVELEKAVRGTARVVSGEETLREEPDAEQRGTRAESLAVEAYVAALRGDAGAARAAAEQVRLLAADLPLEVRPVLALCRAAYAHLLVGPANGPGAADATRLLTAARDAVAERDHSARRCALALGLAAAGVEGARSVEAAEALSGLLAAALDDGDRGWELSGVREELAARESRP